jgi:hypothetical protein
METKIRIIMKHIDGTPVTARYTPSKGLSDAARFPTIEDYQTYITGHYKPPDASQYMPQKIRITYEEMTDDE